ncbi:vesicle transport v-snare protein [Purpureocillium lavendulum]|uniref:Vesicle transport v-snare protein n=1 Tax=Purpureocillium lavendulum TaxID=1247861 RepID=A0AB34G370_9HYPO|nr:vesicle transport v-snare protein [Purpureocillium lavendulum]
MCETETLFHTYSQFSTAANIPPKPTEQERETEAKIQELLEKRESVVSQLARLLDSEASLTSSALKQNNLSLLREKLAAHRRDLGRLRGTLQQARDRANLLTNVRSDIDQYRANNPEAAEAEYMIDERRRIDNSHGMADSVLSQAYAVNDSFLLQRETLSSINRRITLAASKVPGINTLIGRISAKKRRDGIIMGCFIALCFVVWLSGELLSRRGRPAGVFLDFVDDAREALCQALDLVRVAGAAAGPADAAVVVDEGAAEEAHEPGLAGVVLVVDVDELGDAGVALDDVVQGRVGGARGEAGDLLLGPLAAEDGDDGCAAGEQGRRVAQRRVGLDESLAVEVGEEEGELGLEEARGRDEGLALVVLEVAPVAELFAALQVLVVVDKVLLALLEGAAVDARVLAGPRGQRHADGPREGLGDEVALDALAVGARGLDGRAGDGALGVERGARGGLVGAGGARRGRDEASSLVRRVPGWRRLGPAEDAGERGLTARGEAAKGHFYPLRRHSVEFAASVGDAEAVCMVVLSVAVEDGG